MLVLADKLNGSGLCSTQKNSQDTSISAESGSERSLSPRKSFAISTILIGYLYLLGFWNQL